MTDPLYNRDGKEGKIEIEERTMVGCCLTISKQGGDENPKV